MVEVVQANSLPEVKSALEGKVKAAEELLSVKTSFEKLWQLLRAAPVAKDKVVSCELVTELEVKLKIGAVAGKLSATVR